MKIMVQVSECDCCNHKNFPLQVRPHAVPSGTYYRLPLVGPFVAHLGGERKGFADKGFYFKLLGKLYTVAVRNKVRLGPQSK